MGENGLSVADALALQNKNTSNGATDGTLVVTVLGGLSS